MTVGSDHEGQREGRVFAAETESTHALTNFAIPFHCHNRAAGGATISNHAWREPKHVEDPQGT